VDLPLGNQAIKCSVESCKYYHQNACTLKQIQVSACMNANSGNPEDESMCASYERKDK